jgi:hypothetical protein
MALAVVTAAAAYLPDLLRRDPALLERANARLRGTQTVASGFAGPPAGSALLALGRAMPLLADDLGHFHRDLQPSTSEIARDGHLPYRSLARRSPGQPRDRKAAGLPYARTMQGTGTHYQATEVRSFPCVRRWARAFVTNKGACQHTSMYQTLSQVTRTFWPGKMVPHPGMARLFLSSRMVDALPVWLL